MAELSGLEAMDPSEIYSSMWNSLPPEMVSKIDSLFQLGTILLSAIIIYFIVLLLIKIFGSIFGAKRLKRISKSLDTTNEKLEEIIGLLGNKKPNRSRATGFKTQFEQSKKRNLHEEK